MEIWLSKFWSQSFSCTEERYNLHWNAFLKVECSSPWWDDQPAHSFLVQIAFLAFHVLAVQQSESWLQHTTADAALLSICLAADTDGMLALTTQWEVEPKNSYHIWPSKMQFTVASGMFLQSWFGWDSCHRLRVRAQRWLPEHPGLWRRTSSHQWGLWWYPVPWSHQLERWNPVRPGGRVLTKDHQESTPKSPEKFYLNPQHLRELSMKKVTLVTPILFYRSCLNDLSMLLGCTFSVHFSMYLLLRHDGLVCLALKYWECSLFLDQLFDVFLPAGKRPETIEHGIFFVSPLFTMT